MDALTPTPHIWHPLFRKIGGSSWGANLSSHLMHRVDKPIYKWSNGRTTLTTILSGVPILKLTTIGAKSNKPRTASLVSIPDGPNIILIASNWGGEKHPAWYHNLKAHPEAKITIEDHILNYVATEVFGEERERCWETAVSIYPGYNIYAKRVNNRKIPVLKLTPV